MHVLEPYFSQSRHIYHAADEGRGAFDTEEFVSMQGLCGEKSVVASCPFLLFSMALLFFARISAFFCDRNQFLVLVLSSP